MHLFLLECVRGLRPWVKLQYDLAHLKFQVVASFENFLFGTNGLDQICLGEKSLVIAGAGRDSAQMFESVKISGSTYHCFPVF